MWADDLWDTALLKAKSILATEELIRLRPTMIRAVAKQHPVLEELMSVLPDDMTVAQIRQTITIEE